MTDKPIYFLKTTINSEKFEFKNVLPARNYTIEVIPDKIELSNGNIIIYKKAYVNFEPYVTPEHKIVNITADIPFKIEGIIPTPNPTPFTPTMPSKTVLGFETVLALSSITLILRRTNLR